MRICNRNLSAIDLAILRAVQGQPCDGLGRLTMLVEASTRRYVHRRVELLQQAGLLLVKMPAVFPGRGHKIVIMKGKRR